MGLSGEKLWETLAGIMEKKSPLTILPYPEEDSILTENPGIFYVQVSEPVSLMIVLGASNKPENELYIDAVRQDKIPVYKRKGGGGAVLLAPGMVIVTLKGIAKNLFDNKRYFDFIQCIIKVTIFNKIGLKVESNGISDLTICSKKILGSSIYRRRQTLLYQGVLLVEADLKRIGAYIKHPDREPEYRNRRKHDDFVANITQFYPLWRTHQVVRDFREAFRKSFYHSAKCHFTAKDRN